MSFTIGIQIELRISSLLVSNRSFVMIKIIQDKTRTELGLESAAQSVTLMW